MKISVILAHPDQASLNHAMAETVLQTLLGNGHMVFFHDLYAEEFNPLLPAAEIPQAAALDPVIRGHCEEIKAADGIVIIHPNWWGQPPAILKGWIDRVIRPGVAYAFREGDNGEGIPQGLLRARTAVVLNTSNTPEERELAVFGDPLEGLWKHCIFGLCGVETFHRKMFRVVVTSTLQQRLEWLAEVGEIMHRFFPPLEGLNHTPPEEDGVASLKPPGSE